MFLAYKLELYWLARLGRVRSWAIMLNGVQEEGIWKLVWGVEGPPKLHHFIWRACKGSLAIKDRLYYRHIAADSLCQVCGEATETVIHALFECTDAAKIWAPSKYKALLEDAPALSFNNLVCWVADRIDRKEFSHFRILIWAAWFCRNAKIHNEPVDDPVQVAAGYAKLLWDYMEYVGRVFKPISTACGIGSDRWNPPAVGHIKVNSDAHIAEGRWVGLGVVLRDHAGTIIAAATKRIQARWEVEQDEVATAKFGVQVAQQLGYRRIELECNAHTVARTIVQNVVGYSPLMLFYEDIKRMQDNVIYFSCNHVRRVGNTLAHLVARYSTSESTFVWLDNFPQSFVTLTELDLI